MPDRVTEVMDRIRWPHVAMFALVVAATVGFAIFLPDDRWGLVERVVVALLGGGGALGWLVHGGAVRPATEIPPPASLPPRPMPDSARTEGTGRHRPPTRIDGSVDAYALLMVIAIAAALVQTARVLWPLVLR